MVVSLVVDELVEVKVLVTLVEEVVLVRDELGILLKEEVEVLVMEVEGVIDEGVVVFDVCHI